MRVIIVGRSAERCAAAVAAIRGACGHAAVEAIAADLSAQAEVRRVAREFRARHPRLHVLVNNAGGLFALRRESADGIELTLATNHLAAFLLTQLLRPALLDGASATGLPARVVTVSSTAHRDVDSFDFDDPEARRGGLWAYPRSEAANLGFSLLAPLAHPGLRQYARSKLANLLFTRALARRVGSDGITANALHPGVVASHFGDGNGAYGWFMRRFFSVAGISVEKGAATSIHLASAPEVAGTTGAYFNKCRIEQPSPAALDDHAAERLWDLSERMTSRT